MENNENTGAVVETENTETVKTYTQEEVDKLLQSETDKRVTQALRTAEKKNQDKVREAEKLARMNADEKYEYELSQREKAIEAKEQALAMAENKNVAAGILADKGISLKLVDFVVDTDADVMNERIKLLDTEFKKSVKAEVEKRLGSNIPKKNLEEPGSISKKDFANMSLMELQRLSTEQPELYRSLTNN